MAILVIAGILVTGFAAPESESLLAKVHSIIAEEFGQAALTTMQQHRIDRGEIMGKGTPGELVFWTIPTSGDSLALAIVDNVKGKSLPITFLVIFNPDATIRRVAIVKYREAIGGEVTQQPWLKQFMGQDRQSNYTVGQSIDGISGATISVYAVTRGVQRLAFLAPKLMGRLRNTVDE